MKQYLVIGLALLAVVKILCNGFFSMPVAHLESMNEHASACVGHECDTIPVSQCLDHCMRSEPVITGSDVPVPMISVIVTLLALIILVPLVSQFQKRTFLFGSPPGLSFVRNTILRE